jgi:hypothetical protein
MSMFNMKRTLPVLCLTTGVGLLQAAPASAQVTLQFNAVIPPGIAGELKRYGIEIPQDRVKGAVHVQQSANGSLDVRFNQTADTPEPGPTVRTEVQEPAATAALPSPSAPPKSPETPSGPARSDAGIPQEPSARPAAFDGTWSVSMAGGGFLCGSIASQTLTVQNGSVRGDGSGVSVSGQVEPSGSISLALQRSGIRGSASGKLSGASGSGSWTAPSLGCSGQWTAQRRSTVTAQAY